MGAMLCVSPLVVASTVPSSSTRATHPDADGDGHLSVEEFRAAYRREKRGASPGVEDWHRYDRARGEDGKVAWTRLRGSKP